MTNFVFKYPNFSYRGNSGRSGKSLNDIIKFADFEIPLLFVLYKKTELAIMAVNETQQVFAESSFPLLLVRTPIYTVFHKIGTPLYFCNNFFKC